MEVLSNMGIQDNKPTVLRYGSLFAQTLLEKDPENLAILERERSEIEQALGMTSEQILAEARKILIHSE